MKYSGGLRSAAGVLAVSGTYIATVVGAGFASGQEILSFFVKYGNISIAGAAAVSALFGAALYALLQRCRKSGISDFADYLKYSTGRRTVAFLDILASVFMLCVFAAMTACAGMLASQITGISAAAGVFAVSALCFLCFCFELRGLAAVNALLSPLIVIGSIGVCAYILCFREMSVFALSVKKLTDNIAVSSLSYTGYNLLTAAVIAVEMSEMIKTKRQALWAGRLSGAAFFVMFMLMWTVIKIYYGKIELGEIPMLTIVSREGAGLRYIYTAVLSAAILTTALSSGFGMMRRARAALPLNKYICAVLVCVLGMFLSGFGFSNIVEKIYWLCGMAGIVLLFIIIVPPIKS